MRVPGAGAGRHRPSVSKGSGEQSLARTLYPRLEGWLLLADRLFYNWADWCAAAGSGADLLWRVKEDIKLPFLELLPDGSYRSVLVKTSITGSHRNGLIEAARRGEDLVPAKARHIRVAEYEVTTGTPGELIALITTITDWQAAPAAVLAGTYHERTLHRECPGQNRPARPRQILRSVARTRRAGDLGYLLTAWPSAP